MTEADGAERSAGERERKPIGGLTAPALAQLKARRYADKVPRAEPQIHLIGVEVSATTRSITAFDVNLPEAWH